MQNSIIYQLRLNSYLKGYTQELMNKAFIHPFPGECPCSNPEYELMLEKEYFS